jgi:hypothetical protein
MNKFGTAKLIRNSGLRTTYSTTAAIAALAPFKPVTNQIVVCNAAFTDCENKAVAAGISWGGLTINAKTAKHALADHAANVLGNAYVRFEILGKHDLSAQLHFNESDYTHASDPEAITMAQEGYNIISANLVDLTTDYVTLADATTLQSLIDTLKSSMGKKESARKASPADTAAFEKALKVADTAIDNFVIVLRPVQKANIGLYNALILNTHLPPINVHHTYLNVTVLDAATNTPIVGAVLSINTSDKKTATTDADGNATIERLRSGATILTIAAPGKEPKEVHLQVSRGKNNEVEVKM